MQPFQFVIIIMMINQVADKDIREDFMVKTDEEVAALIHNAIQGLGDPIQVVFKNQKCQACSEVGDARLMSRYVYSSIQ